MAWDGYRRLYYYPPATGFTDCALSVDELLVVKNGAGQCGSFYHLFAAALGINGIGPPSIVSAAVGENTGLGMIVNNWAWDSGDSGDPVYPYRLQLTGDHGGGMVPPSPDNRYGNLTSLPGAPGQNTPTPSEKVFGSHYILKLVDLSLYSGHGPYFDPSYGLEYRDAADFETQAIAGFARPISVSDGLWFAKRRIGTGAIYIIP
jgi:hypothetical protein